MNMLLYNDIKMESGCLHIRSVDISCYSYCALGFIFKATNQKSRNNSTFQRMTKNRDINHLYESI